MGLPDGSFIALRADTGALKWTYKLETEGRSIRSSAAVWNDRVYFGGGDGAIYALNLADGSMSWKFQTEGRVDPTPLIVGGDGLQDGQSPVEAPDQCQHWTIRRFLCLLSGDLSTGLAKGARLSLRSGGALTLHPPLHRVQRYMRYCRGVVLA